MNKMGCQLIILVSDGLRIFWKNLPDSSYLGIEHVCNIYVYSEEFCSRADHIVRIYDRHGLLIEEISLPGWVTQK